MSLFCLICTDGRTLKTCALRPAGIYGEGELRHLPRIVVCTIVYFVLYKQIQRPVGYAKKQRVTCSDYYNSGISMK